MSAFRQPGSFSGPAPNGAEVTPNDSVDFPRSRGLYVGGEGDVTVDFQGEGTAVTFVGVPAGFILPVQVTRVYATGTTATNIVRLS